MSASQSTEEMSEEYCKLILPETVITYNALTTQIADGQITTTNTFWHLTAHQLLVGVICYLIMYLRRDYGVSIQDAAVSMLVNNRWS